MVILHKPNTNTLNSAQFYLSSPGACTGIRFGWCSGLQFFQISQNHRPNRTRPIVTNNIPFTIRSRIFLLFILPCRSGANRTTKTNTQGRKSLMQLISFSFFKVTVSALDAKRRHPIGGNPLAHHPTTRH